MHITKSPNTQYLTYYLADICFAFFENRTAVYGHVVSRFNSQSTLQQLYEYLLVNVMQFGIALSHRMDTVHIWTQWLRHYYLVVGRY